MGYIVSRDRYLKRDELGVIYQLCVEGGAQRKLVGAALVREVFARSAYGCKLYCCWCAQDLEANYFWESMGFLPIAFRAGSSGKKRVHIFWQRRIVEGDNTTPFWFPSQTNQGAIREDRLVLPIPAGGALEGCDAGGVAWGSELGARRSEFGKTETASGAGCIPNAERRMPKADSGAGGAVRSAAGDDLGAGRDGRGLHREA